MTGGAYTYASELTQVGLGLELASAVGVAVPPTVQLVIDKAPDSADNINPIEDKGMRGTMAEVWDIVQGTVHATVSLSGPVMCDTFPWLLANFYGDTVYQGTTTTPTTTLSTAITAANIAAGVTSAQVAGSIPSGTLIQIDTGLNSEVRTTTSVTGTGPYVVSWSASQPLKVPHLGGATVTAIASAFTTIQSLMNSGGYGGQVQPPTMTVTDLNQVSANFGRQYAGWSIDTLTIKSSPNGLLTFDAKGLAWPSNTLASVPTLPISPVVPTAGWKSTVNLSGSAVSNVTEWEIGLTRKVSVIETTDGSQAPYAIRRGSAAATTKFRVAAADESPLLTYLAGTAVPMVFGTTNGLSGANTLSTSFNLPKVKYVDSTKIDRSKEEVGFTVEARCLPATSAAGWTGGASHLQTTTVNAVTPNTYSL
jgi:hypothetical protein